MMKPMTKKGYGNDYCKLVELCFVAVVVVSVDMVAVVVVAAVVGELEVVLDDQTSVEVNQHHHCKVWHDTRWWHLLH